MFTGIIEDLGQIQVVEKEGSNLHLTVKSKLTPELKIDQSVAHNGVCLTVVAIEKDTYQVTAIDETLNKTNIGDLKSGDIVNLERSMVFGERVDGHIVYGHVDSMGVCTNVLQEDGSWVFTFQYDAQFKNLMVEKGSVSLNGTSLTIFEVTNSSFSVAIIPYTFENTSIKNIAIGSKVNLEFDIFGKYVEKHLQNR